MGDVLATAVASDGLLQLGLGNVEVFDKRLAVGNGVEVVLVNLQVEGRVGDGRSVPMELSVYHQSEKIVEYVVL